MLFFIYLEICIFILSAVSKKCEKDFDIKLSTIILSNESEKYGAKFLHKLSVDSLEECMKYCCDSNTCTAGIYGPNKFSTCLLFNCHEPNVCNFTSEPDHTVFVQIDSKSILPKILKVENSQAGALRGVCGPRNPCVGKNTICDSGQCVCKAGFIEKRHKCVPSLCSKPDLQFQCDDGTACIAIYDVCNGISECHDGSDEDFCDKSAIIFPPVSTKLPILKSHTTESKPDETLHRSGPSNNGYLTEVDFDSPIKELSTKNFQIFRSVPPRRALRDRRDYFSPEYFSTVESYSPIMIVAEPRRKSLLSDETLDSFVDRPSGDLQLHGDFLQPSFLDKSSYPKAELELIPSRRRLGRLPGHSRYATLPDLVSDNEEEEEPPLNRGIGFHDNREFQRLKPNRHLKLFLGSKTKGKDLKLDENMRTTDTLKKEKSTTNSISSFVHSGFQWHTAAILLAVGLGLISCLFGILVGQCRQRGQFDMEGPRSKAVAQRHLRRRILRTRGLSNSDIEKNWLLSKLQL